MSIGGGRTMTRPFAAGRAQGNCLVEQAHLMYQNDHAQQFLEALKEVIDEELKRRSLGKKNVGHTR